MVRCCADSAAVLRAADRADRSGDLFGKLKADVRVTRQQRKTSAAAALRILSVTRWGFCHNAFTCRAQKPQAVSNPAILFVFDLSVVNLHHLIAPHIITKLLA